MSKDYILPDIYQENFHEAEAMDIQELTKDLEFYKDDLDGNFGDIIESILNQYKSKGSVSDKQRRLLHSAYAKIHS